MSIEFYITVNNLKSNFYRNVAKPSQKHLQQFISRDPQFKGLEDMIQFFKVEIHLFHNCNMYFSPLGPKIFVHSKFITCCS